MSRVPTTSANTGATRAPADRPNRMIPLKVTAFTPHGVVLSRPWGVALDGLLASVLWHRTKAEAAANGAPLTYHLDAEPETLELPLGRCGVPGHDEDWHWLATFADLHPHPAQVDARETDIRWRTSRTDRNRLQQLAPVIGRQVVSDSSGRYQRRVVPVIAHPATSLTWRAVGDPDAIRGLLAELPSIGKHRGVGEGLVSRWEVTVTHDADEWSAGHEHSPGVLGRTVPLRCNPTESGRSAGVAAIRPPYLHPGSRRPSYAPDR